MDKFAKVTLKYFLFLVCLTLLFAISFVIASHVVKTSSDGISFSFNEDVSNLFNISVNNTDVGEDSNITQVNITLPESFTFIMNTNGSDQTSGLYGDFENISNILIWQNETLYNMSLIRANETKYFWFNASASTPGDYNITISSLNATGIYTTNISVQINDTTGPYVAFVNPINTTYNNATGYINITNSTDASSIWFNRNGSNVIYTTPELTVFNEGINNITVWANDSLNNVNTTTVYFTVDTIYPQFSIYSDNNASFNDSGQGWFNVTLMNTNGTVILEINNTNITATNLTIDMYNATYAFTTNGTYTYRWYSWGNASNANLNISTTRYFAVNATPDTTGPYVAFITPENITYTNANQYINITNSTDASSIWFNRNGTNVTYTEAVLTTFNEGLNNITVWANDSLNNINTTTVYFTVDTTPPFINITQPTNLQVSNSEDIDVTYINSSDVSSCWYSNDTMSINTTIVGCTSITDIIWTNGVHNLTVWVNDSLGNTNSSTVSFTIDNQPPYSVEFGVDATTSANHSQNWIYVNITALDARLAGFKSITIYVYNSSGLVNNTTALYTSPYAVNFTDLVDGNYFVNATANDTIEYSNSSVTRIITLDTLGPVLNWISPLNLSAPVAEQITTLNITLSDFLSGINVSDISNDLEFNVCSGEEGLDISCNESEGVHNSITCWQNWTTPLYFNGSCEVNATYSDLVENAGFDSVDVYFPLVNIDSFEGDSGNNISLGLNGPSPFNLYLYANKTNGTFELNFNLSHSGICSNLEENDLLNLLPGDIEDPLHMFYTACTPNNTKLIELGGGNTGFYNLSVIGYLNGSSSSDSENLTIYYDFEIPMVAFITPENITYTNANQYINITNSSDVSSIWFNRNGTNVTYTEAVLTTFNEGLNNITVWANDSFNNINNTTIYFTVDTTPPFINITQPTNLQVSNSEDIDVTYINSSDVSSCWYSNDTMSINTTIVGCTSITDIIWTNGVHNLTVWVNDSLGNTNSSTVSFTIDNQPPYSVEFGVDATTSANHSQNWIYVNITALDARLAGFKSITIYVYNSSGLVNNTTALYTSPYAVNFTDLVDGNYFVNATANDTIEYSNSSVTRIITLDTTVPYIEFVSPTNITYTNATILLNITNSTDASAIWFNRNGTNVTYTEAVLTTFNEGLNNITLWSNDSLNNVNTTTVYFTVDTTGPYVAFVNPTNTTYTNATILLNITNSTDASAIWFNRNGTNVTYTEAVLTTFNEGLNNITLWSNDSLNNVNTTTVYFTIDTTFPGIEYSINSTISDGYVQNWTYFYVNVTGDYNTTKIYLYNSTRYLINFTNSTGSITFINFTDLLDGTYYINATVNDSVGNVNSTATRIIILDNNGPDITVNTASSASSAAASSSVIFNITANINSTSCVYNLGSGSNVTMNSTDNKTFTKTSTVVAGTYTVLYYCNDSFGTANRTSKSLTVSDTSSSGDDDGDSPGGGSSGGATTPATNTSSPQWNYTYIINESQFLLGHTYLLGLKQRINFTFNNASHSLGIFSLTSSRVGVRVSSTPQDKYLNIGDEAMFDINDDNYYDVYVKINSINLPLANVTLKWVYEEIPANSNKGSTNKSAVNNKSKAEEITKEIVKKLPEKRTWWMILLVVVVVLIIVSFILSIVYLFLMKGLGKKHFDD